MIAAQAKDPGKTKAEAPGQKAKQQPASPKEPAFNLLWQRLALGAQAKLTVSAPDDPFERETDRVADPVMRMAEPRVQLKCVACEEEEEKLQRKESGNATDDPATIPPIVQQALNAPGQPLDPATRGFFEPRFGHDFGPVRVHTDRQASEAARSVAAQAFTLGEHVVFANHQYAPENTTGRHLLAHELVHVVQQRAGERGLHRRAANCPSAPPSPPTITTMADFIGLVQRVEASTPTGSDPIATARLISRTKYEGRAWDWLLPSTKGVAGTVVGGTVTADDIGSLCFKLIVSVPGGGMEDPMHVIAAIVADAETLPAGTGATGWSSFVKPLPASVSQRGVSTWVGDVGKAAAEWIFVHPTPKKATTKADYMAEDAPPHDLMGNVDGVAITSKSAASGFAFDKTKPLSDNLQRFFTPAAHTGRERRFHVFCNAEGFALEADGFTLTAGAKATIGQRVHDFSHWLLKNDPTLFEYGLLMAASNRYWILEMGRRINDWQWFADRFIDFVQNNLTAEGP